MDAMKADVRNGCNDFNFNMFSDRAAAACISLPSICNWTPTGPMRGSKIVTFYFHLFSRFCFRKNRLPFFGVPEARPMFWSLRKPKLVAAVSRSVCSATCCGFTLGTWSTWILNVPEERPLVPQFGTTTVSDIEAWVPVRKFLAPCVLKGGGLLLANQHKHDTTIRSIGEGKLIQFKPSSRSGTLGCYSWQFVWSKLRLLATHFRIHRNHMGIISLQLISDGIIIIDIVEVCCLFLSYQYDRLAHIYLEKSDMSGEIGGRFHLRWEIIDFDWHWNWLTAGISWMCFLVAHKAAVHIEMRYHMQHYASISTYTTAMIL